MADEIRKVGLELTAEGAKDFKTAMKDIAASTKEAYSELKLAQSQYDKNTSATQKLADRQKYLQTVTEDYTKKEAILKAQLEELENAENRDEAAISKKKTELNNCQASLNKYEKALKDVTAQIETHSAQLKEWGEKLQRVGGDMKKVGDNMTKYVTAPIVGLGAASVVAWKEVDEGMDIVTKKTGATGEALADMQNRARDIAKSMPTDFATAGEAVGEVNTRFGLTGDALQELSVKFIEFAEINDTDVSTSIDNVQSMMAAWNIETDRAGDMLDLLTKAGQDTGVSVDTLAQQLMQNKTALDEMGFSLDQSVDLLASCEKNGVDTSTMLTGLKKALQNSAKEGKSSSQALKELQDRLTGAESDAEAAQIAMELFGNKAGPALADACRDGRLNLEDLGYAFEDFAGTTSDTFDEVKSPLDEMQPILNTLKDTGAQLVTDLGPLIVELLGKLAEGASKLSEWWSGLDEGQKNMVFTFAALAAAIGPVISIVGSLTSAIGFLVATIGPVIAGGGGVMAVLTALLGPVGLVVAAIAAVIAIGVLLYQNWDTICEWAGKLKDTVTQKWDELKTNTINKATEIKNKVTDKFTELKNKVEEKINLARDAVGRAIDKIKGFFNFSWSLPHLKLPHVSISGSFSLAPPSVPSFSVDWYGKAYDAAYLLTGPSVLSGGGRAIGGGERGNEIILGEDYFERMLIKALQSLGGFGDQIVINIYPAAGMDENEIAELVQQKLALWERQRQAAMV